jgi:hypothetical protein
MSRSYPAIPPEGSYSAAKRVMGPLGPKGMRSDGTGREGTVTTTLDILDLDLDDLAVLRDTSVLEGWDALGKRDSCELFLDLL